jgi:regulator of sigma E protease
MGARDPFVFRQRLVLLAGKPMVIQVVRAGDAEGADPVNIFVPPAYHWTLGLRMKMGKVAAIRKKSPAEEAGLRPGEEIKSVKLQYGNEPAVTLDEDALDPVRLPFELNRRIHADPKKDVKQWRVRVTVSGTQDHDAQKERTLEPMTWDDSWELDGDSPNQPWAPMSIPQLGIAYWVESTVVKVAPGSPAAVAKLKAGDEIREMRLRVGGKTADAEKTWGPWVSMASTRGQGPKVYDRWAYYFWELQHSDFPIIEVKIARDGQDRSDALGPIEAVADTSWPLVSRGLMLTADTYRRKADNLRDAMMFGLDDTITFIKNIYINLSRLLSRRISPQTLGGPFEIARQAFYIAGENIFEFMMFLGIISINLAVVNFLPIPVLDGGHMVFLIYEKLRGQPPSETVRAVATYVGLAMILFLMLFVFYQDIRRFNWLPSWM